MKDVVIFVLSPFPKFEATYHFTDFSGKFDEYTHQTNESCLKYLIWKLAKEGKKLDRAFVFLTKDLEDNGQFDKFKELFSDLPMTQVYLPSGQVDAAMLTISEMNEKLVEYRNNNNEPVRINVDITGGFRHASMMMLSLTQLLRYCGFEIGEVTYANIYITPNVVEDASDLLDFTSLIGGAEEFVTFGSVKQIQSYFPVTERPARLQILLSKMEELSETLRLCCNYRTTVDALSGLNAAIGLYEESLAKAKDIKAEELYFSKLLPRIKEEYGELMSDGEHSTPMHIIRWNLNKGLLQQAVASFTEWLPRYMVGEGKFVSVADKSIIKECKEKGKMWSHWSIYFFRNYKPSKKDIPNNTDGNNITYEFKTRTQVFEYLLDKGKITIPQKKDKVILFIETYKKIVERIRNKFAHANANSDLVNDRMEIVEDMQQALKLLSGK